MKHKPIREQHIRFTLKQLEYFVAAGEIGSVKRAADQIAISQPSVSSAIVHLEEELGVQLFVRHHAQGVSLTKAGKIMMQEAKILLEKANELYNVANESSDTMQGEVNVGFMVTVAPLIAPELTYGFTNKYPKVKTKISEGSHEEMLKKLQSLEIDVAVTYNLEIPTDVDFYEVAELPPYVLVAENHPLAKEKNVTLRQLHNEPMVLLGLAYSQRYFLGLFEAEKLTPKVEHITKSSAVARTMVANGHGYTIANIRAKNKKALDGNKLKEVEIAGDHKPMKIGYMTLKQKNKPNLISTFEQHCRKIISRKFK